MLFVVHTSRRTFAKKLSAGKVQAFLDKTAAIDGWAYATLPYGNTDVRVVYAVSGEGPAVDSLHPYLPVYRKMEDFSRAGVCERCGTELTSFDVAFRGDTSHTFRCEEHYER